MIKDNTASGGLRNTEEKSQEPMQRLQSASVALTTTADTVEHHASPVRSPNIGSELPTPSGKSFFG